MLKSFCKKQGNKLVEWNRVPPFQGSADDTNLINAVVILERVCDPSENEREKKHFNASISVLEAIINWRNAVYKRIGVALPSDKQLAVKHKSVSIASKKLHEAFAMHFKKSSPYLHAILHNDAYLKCDVVDRSAEALGHLNKIIKPITKRGLKRYKTVKKEKAQKETALKEGRSSQGIHLGYKGSGTSRFVMVESTARKFYDDNYATRQSYWARTLSAYDLLE